MLAGAKATQGWRAVGAAVALLVVMIGYGAWRLQQMPTRFVDGVKLRIMQPNLQQDVRFNYSAKADVMSKYLALSDRATGPQSTGVRDATILVWPESAFPFFLAREADAMAQIANLLPEGTRLITGSVRAPEGPLVRPVTRAYNSIYVIDHDGSILSIYDKLHLVPFGEYLPFQSLMERLGFEQLTKVAGRLSCRRSPSADDGAGRAADAAADLLRGGLSIRQRDDGRASRLDRQSDQ